jgi:glucose-6-phosphate 1-dehydrogenase
MPKDTPTLQLEPTVLVIFGITGDLAQRKVLPALYHLFRAGLVHENTYVVGTSRQTISVEDIVTRIREAVGTNDGACDQAVLDRMRSYITMVQLDPGNEADYDNLRSHLQNLEDQVGVCLQRLFYLSIPPQIYGDIVQRLGHHQLNQGCSHGNTSTRLLVEKPFGFDTASAQELIAKTAEHFDEQQIYRIDHYLAKETAQNILTFRQKNPLFNTIWNGEHISGISVTAAEQIGIEGRANFYDNVGALRDLIQSHLMQLLSLTLMEIPSEITSESIHAGKQAVLDAILAVPADAVNDRAVRGQYASYKTETDSPDSSTETFASLVLFSQDPRWQGIPLRLTTGKALKIKRTSITIDFGSQNTNRLQLRIQPNEGITLTMQVKKPGLAQSVESTTMEFAYDTAFLSGAGLDAYERVLIEAIRGDHLLFATDKEILSSWRILQPVIDAWKGNTDIPLYESGSDGPDISRLQTS